VQLLLKKLPTEEVLREMKARFPSMDIEVAGTYVHYLRTSTTVLARMESILAGYDMTPARLPVLLSLLHAGANGIRPSDLADEVGVTRATMTGLLDSLEKAGLIAREADPSDRRALVIKITPIGTAVCERVFPIHMRNITTLLKDLSEADHRALRTCMAKIQAGLERLETIQADSAKPVDSNPNDPDPEQARPFPRNLGGEPPTP
jgi:DNA-binding MarR family transcriptional regulator